MVDTNYAIAMEIRSLQEDEIENLCQRSKTRLNARCRDLLYVTHNTMETGLFEYQVDFLHRTVRDFFLDTGVIGEIIEKRPTRKFNAQLSLCKIMLALTKIMPIGKNKAQVFNHAFILSDGLMHYANKVETYVTLEQDGKFLQDPKSSTEAFEILDELDRTNTKRLSLGGVHWTNFEDPPKGNFSEWRKKSFLAATIQAALSMFTEHRLKKNPAELRLKGGRPLLDYALRLMKIAPLSITNLEQGPVLPTVKLLLELGAQPNAGIYIYDNRTPWELFLEMCYQHVTMELESQHIVEDLGKAIVLLVSYGARTSGSFRVSEGVSVDFSTIVNKIDLPCHQLCRERYGVIGYGISMYDPPCAFSCIQTVGSWMLQCDDDHNMGEHMSSMHMAAATPECKATNDAFLQTVAWCIYTHCPDQKNSTLEKIWEMEVVGRLKVQPTPKYSYQTALSLVIKEPPTMILDSQEILNRTSLADEDAWQSNFNADYIFEKMDALNERYGIVLMTTCVAIPIVFSCLRFLPLPPTLVSKFYATFIDPPLFGSNYRTPVLGLGFVPNRGQGLFIAYISIINVVLSVVGYELRDPMSWYPSLEQQILAYIGNRTGLLSFVNLAIAVLFSSRNNVLLWVTNWSASTFLLIHRWVAVICMLQACLHSVIYLRIYRDPLTGEGAYEKEAKEDYWIWGTVATLALVLLIPFSILPLRKKLYEFFLATHVVLALFSMIGCMLHIFYRYEWQWGYQTWIWITFAFWIFDRFLARPTRIARNGFKKAFVKVIDEDYMQLTIPGVEAEGHVYLYFPTLTWRVWENHPFSVATASSGNVLREAQSHDASDSQKLDEKNVSRTTDLEGNYNEARTPGLVVFVRRHGGLTSLLSSHAMSAGLRVLVEGAYGQHTSLLASPALQPTIEYNNMICIAGGVGITGVLPCLDTKPGLTGIGKKKLFWGVRTEPLVDAVRAVIPRFHVAQDGQEIWNDFDVSISIGKRFDLKAILDEEFRGVEGGTTVVVCGPLGMADEVRVIVTRLGREGVIVRLAEESFT
ncbi:hypothetical protein FGRMN_1825 [Fusarium graminum]|nr:hypothetical protein FGRMN_1825 [Fusarium graminum]